MAAPDDGVRLAVLAEIQHQGVDLAGRPFVRRFDPRVGAVVAHIERTLTGPMPPGELLQILAALVLDRVGHEEAIRSEEVSVDVAFAGARVERHWIGCDELLDVQVVLNREPIVLPIARIFGHAHGNLQRRQIGAGVGARLLRVDRAVLDPPSVGRPHVGIFVMIAVENRARFALALSDVDHVSEHLARRPLGRRRDDDALREVTGVGRTLSRTVLPGDLEERVLPLRRAEHPVLREQVHPHLAFALAGVERERIPRQDPFVLQGGPVSPSRREFVQELDPLREHDRGSPDRGRDGSSRTRLPC